MLNKRWTWERENESQKIDTSDSQRKSEER